MPPMVQAEIEEAFASFHFENSDAKDFTQNALNSIDDSDLSETSGAEIIAALQNTYRHYRKHSGSGVELIFAPPVGGDDPLMIDVIAPDMPYIVDSVLAAIRHAGGRVRLFAHPIARTGERATSVLHIQADPLADIEGLRAEISQTLKDVQTAVEHTSQMIERVRLGADEIPTSAPGAGEAKAFIEWLTRYNFTFLGVQAFDLVGDELVRADGEGLGLFRDPEFKVVRNGVDYVHSTAELVDFARSEEPILVTKANLRTRVHRRAHLDYVGIKRYDSSGAPCGELRIVGLYTAQAQSAPHTEVPIIRRKIAEVMQRSGVDPLAHAGRVLLSALNSYPRDELFQISVEELDEFARAIAALHDRPRVRVLPRVDRFDNFVSVLVYVPRDQYDGDLRAQITTLLADAYEGRVSAFYPHFLESELVRLHVIIGRNGGETPRPDRRALERDIEALTLTFGDQLMSAATAGARYDNWRNAFTAAYQSRHQVADAVDDIGVFNTIGEDIAVRLRALDDSQNEFGLKFYSNHHPIPLSDRVPMLEHFGFRVIDERTYTITPSDGGVRYLHDLVLEVNGEARPDLLSAKSEIENAILSVWHTEAESDQLNALTVLADLKWQDAALLRALSRFLRQVGTPFSQRYIAQVLVTQKHAARALVDLFDGLHNPAHLGLEHKSSEARARLADILSKTASLDEDTIIRRFQNLIDSSLRTNAFQSQRQALAIKFDSSKIEGLAEPKPYREIAVYSPRVEGTHLRFGPIARGGLRWSDRQEDYRTEVLGLVKAQQVKNAVIVPVGAKGGFVPKQLSPGMSRDEFMAEGTASYRIFIGSLLDVTDNLMEGQIIPPQNVVRRDGDDAYLVVAADKGTASFSDIANSIALERGFWLGDAFASGGSVGYDHKKMAITARGAWEAVKRHFREMDHDTQAQPFTVAGVGDMSGDVFGNGMLLSPHIRLVAAFDHRDIFIDPTPDEASGFAERKRLFALPRSSWQDYDKSLISAGGGVFSRSAKAIVLSPEIQQLLDLHQSEATPREVMQAILRARVDLMWFGGIGTYIKAAAEDNGKVGDRANDAVRVNADEVRAKVVGEGANLGVTQLGRVAYALNGGRINTDAIDNSAGVNSSDLEVNIKIALAPVVASGALSQEARVPFLASLTDELAQLCLANNYRQTLTLTQAECAGGSALPSFITLMADLESEGRLSRDVEFLPSDEALEARSRDGKSLTRPELAVLMAYAKLSLFDQLMSGAAPDHDYLKHELVRYFPPKLAANYAHAIENHRLKREVVATVLSNAMINYCGPSFVSDMRAATSADATQAALAYVAVRDSFELEQRMHDIDALDGVVSSPVQLALYDVVRNVWRQETLWFLRNTDLSSGFDDVVGKYRRGVETLRAEAQLLTPEQMQALDSRAQGFLSQGVPSALARHVAELPVLAHATDITLVAERTGADLATAARAFFGVAGLFDLFNLVEQAKAISLADQFDRMALDRAIANVMRALRDLSKDALNVGSLEALLAARGSSISHARDTISRLNTGELTVAKLSVAAGLLADLAQEA